MSALSTIKSTHLALYPFAFKMGTSQAMKYPNRLKEIREDRHLSQEQLADKLNTSRGQIYQLEKGIRKLTQPWMMRLASALDCLPEDFIKSGEKPKVPVIGSVGAGGKIYPIDDATFLPHSLREGEQEFVNCEFVEAPPGVYPSEVACVKVSGHSQYPVYKDGEYLFFKRSVDYSDTFLNHDCVVMLEDGRSMIKILKKGDQNGLFNLDSYNEPTIPNVKIKWASPVMWTKKNIKT